MNERASANFTYTHDTVTAVVIDLSPSAETDRVWYVGLVLDGQWVELTAPVVPFETVSQFLDALIEANV